MKVQLTVRVGDNLFFGPIHDQHDEELEYLYAKLKTTTGRREILNPFTAVAEGSAGKGISAYFGDAVADQAIISVIEY